MRCRSARHISASAMTGPPPNATNAMKSSTLLMCGVEPLKLATTKGIAVAKAQTIPSTTPTLTGLGQGAIDRLRLRTASHQTQNIE